MAKFCGGPQRVKSLRVILQCPIKFDINFKRNRQLRKKRQFLFGSWNNRQFFDECFCFADGNADQKIWNIQGESSANDCRNCWTDLFSINAASYILAEIIRLFFQIR
jgi:hypothetical protein